jgi:hypothetical protein
MLSDKFRTTIRKIPIKCKDNQMAFCPDCYLTDMPLYLFLFLPDLIVI